MEVLQLLVEVVTQALQFIRVTQFLRVDYFVEAGGVSLVVGTATLWGLRLRGACFRRLLSVTCLAFVLEFRRRRLYRVDRALVGIVGRLIGRFALD